MNELRFEKKMIPSAHFNGESSLPPISEDLGLIAVSPKCELDEDDGLFLAYGEQPTAFPYRYRDLYDRALDDTEYETAVLENEHLTATFIPSLGGKLWSLYDKDKNEELLFVNSAVRPCNLAVRNAWTSGGIEWNCGYRGHGPYTCDTIFTARTMLEDGTPVLRFYFFDRIRVCTVQMDFFLKDQLLMARMRITNPNLNVIPMYWWSNIAVRQKDGDRVIVSADEAYSLGDHGVSKFKIPEYFGTDISYPLNNPISKDYFWKVKGRKYITQLDSEGFGLFEASTSGLKGRKMFVWGNSQGGERWQSFLTKDGESGAYDEIQCGLAATQYECLPMPPRTTWEWLECYGGIQCDKEKAHGDWHGAQMEVERALNDIITADELENILDDTRSMAKSRAETLITPSGWPALELMRLQKLGRRSMNEHLDFGVVDAEQDDWVNLLENGTVGQHDADDVPISYMSQPEWIKLLKKAMDGKDKDNWYAYYLLGTAQAANLEFNAACASFSRSIELCESAWADYSMAIALRELNRENDGLPYIIRAHELKRNDLSLAKETLKYLHRTRSFEKVIEIFEASCDAIRYDKRITLYYAYALANTGRLDDAEKLLLGEDGKTYLVVPDVRECETSVTDLWFFIKKQRGIDEKDAMPPMELDFRMFVPKKGQEL